MLISCLLLGCVAIGQQYSPREQTTSSDPQIIVFRISQIGGNAGTWVPTRIEVNEKEIAKLPDDSFIAFNVLAGEITLSATPMFNLHYSDKNRVTLRVRVGIGEVAYFRIVSVFGRGCTEIFEKVDGSELAYTTHYPRPDWAQTVCFQQVPKTVALKELMNLKQAN